MKNHWLWTVTLIPSSAPWQLALVEYFCLDPRPADLGIAKAMEFQSNQKVKALGSFASCNNHECPEESGPLSHHTPRDVPLREPATLTQRVSGAGGRGRQECWAPSGVRRM